MEYWVPNIPHVMVKMMIHDNTYKLCHIFQFLLFQNMRLQFLAWGYFTLHKSNFCQTENHTFLWMKTYFLFETWHVPERGRFYRNLVRPQQRGTSGVHFTWSQSLQTERVHKTGINKWLLTVLEGRKGWHVLLSKYGHHSRSWLYCTDFPSQ